MAGQGQNKGSKSTTKGKKNSPASNAPIEKKRKTTKKETSDDALPRVKKGSQSSRKKGEPLH
jgi:hypothetical protein